MNDKRVIWIRGNEYLSPEFLNESWLCDRIYCLDYFYLNFSLSMLNLDLKSPYKRDTMKLRISYFKFRILKISEKTKLENIYIFSKTIAQFHLAGKKQRKKAKIKRKKQKSKK